MGAPRFVQFYRHVARHRGSKCADHVGSHRKFCERSGIIIAIEGQLLDLPAGSAVSSIPEPAGNPPPR